MPIFSRYAAALEAFVLVSTAMSDVPLRAERGIGLGDHDHQVGQLAVGDEGLGNR